MEGSGEGRREGKKRQCRCVGGLASPAFCPWIKPFGVFPTLESKHSMLRTQKSTGLKVAQRSVCTFSQRTQWGQDTFQQQKDKSWGHKWNRNCEVYMRPALKTPSSHKTERNRQKASKEPADGPALQVGTHKPDGFLTKQGVSCLNQNKLIIELMKGGRGECTPKSGQASMRSRNHSRPQWEKWEDSPTCPIRP